MNTFQGVGRHPATLAAALLALTAALPSPARAQVQMNDKWITIVTSAEPPDLDGCQTSRQHQGRVVKQNVVETLTERNATDSAIKPRLATSWERTDPLTWVIKLRQGVVFHDGAPFNAAAVKASLDRSRGSKVVCGDFRKFLGDLPIEVTPLDDYTLQIKTARPEPIMPVRLAGTGIVSPNTSQEKLVLNPVGTGPYVFDSWQAGQQIIIKRNEKYWGAKPVVEGVRYVWREESSVRAAMVKIGEADIGLALAPQEADDPKIDYSSLTQEALHLRLDTTMPPMNDRRVRLALNYALDPNLAIGTILPKGTLRATQIVGPSIPGHNHELDKRVKPYDLAKAKALLAEAKADGVPVDTEILLISYPVSLPNSKELMEAFFTMYKAVGLNVKLVTVEPGQYAKWNTKPFADVRQPSILQSLHDNTSGDPLFSVYTKYGCDGGNSTYCNPDFDKEVLRVLGLSGQARVDGWHEIFRTLYDDLVPDVPLYHVIGFTRVNPRIKFTPDVTTNNEIRIQEISFK